MKLFYATHTHGYIDALVCVCVCVLFLNHFLTRARFYCMYCVNRSLASINVNAMLYLQFTIFRSVLVACSKQSGRSSTSAPLFTWLVTHKRSEVAKSVNYSEIPSFPTCASFHSEFSVSMNFVIVFRKGNLIS